MTQNNNFVNPAQYILTSINQVGLQQPSYFTTFQDMIQKVISEFRNDLIENEATYKTIIDFDDAIKHDYEWAAKDDYENTFIKIDHKRQQIKAKTSDVDNYGLEFFGELIPNEIEVKK